MQTKKGQMLVIKDLELELLVMKGLVKLLVAEEGEGTEEKLVEEEDQQGAGGLVLGLVPHLSHL